MTSLIWFVGNKSNQWRHVKSNQWRQPKIIDVIMTASLGNKSKIIDVILTFGPITWPAVRHYGGMKTYWLPQTAVCCRWRPHSWPAPVNAVVWCRDWSHRLPDSNLPPLSEIIIHEKKLKNSIIVQNVLIFEHIMCKLEQYDGKYSNSKRIFITVMTEIVWLFKPAFLRLSLNCIKENSNNSTYSITNGNSYRDITNFRKNLDMKTVYERCIINLKTPYEITISVHFTISVHLFDFAHVPLNTDTTKPIL